MNVLNKSVKTFLFLLKCVGIFFTAQMLFYCRLNPDIFNGLTYLVTTLLHYTTITSLNHSNKMFLLFIT